MNTAILAERQEKSMIRTLILCVFLIFFTILCEKVKKNVILQRTNVSESTMKWQSDTASWTKNW